MISKQGAARPQQLDDAACQGRRIAGGGTQQRTPRELNADQVCKVGELPGKRLEGGDDEPCVRQATARRGPGGSPGGPCHARAAGIDSDDELARVRGGAGQHGTAITGTQVDRHRRVGGRGGGQLTDIHLAEATADLNLHRRMIIRG